ncbi:MAG TPA: transposase, partial [Candidatus Hodarchaeales archaeon]|nr:transposase [Candidatus Hodarchaeales archaeon]
MFRKNTTHHQTQLFNFSAMVPQRMLKGIEESEEAKFHEIIFSNINEEDFRCLYSEVDSRPNAPINCMVTAIFLHYRRSWTYEQLLENIQFNLLTKVALGLQTLDELPFVESTLFNFLNRLASHFVETGENLLEKVFDRLTEKQIKELKLRTDIQRTDSFQAASNIRQYTRLQLLVEMLIRVYRVLREDDKKHYEELFAPYIRKTSGQYIYRLKADELMSQFEAIGAVYRQITAMIARQYADVEVFKIFARVYAEHFAVAGEKIVLRASDEMGSGSLQSPDDVDATYRCKNGESYRGQVVNVTETANPDNQLQLITDVAVAANNIDDSDILESR